MSRGLKYIAFAAVAFVVWLCLVEILIRIFFTQPAVLHRLDPVLGYVGIPNASGWYLNKSREFKVKLRMNRHGFRDVDHDIEKPRDVFRILFLGDSFTEAKEVELEETYWRILQATLPALPDGRRVEIINMAVSGYSTGQELLMLKTRGLAFKPDLVVVGLTEFSDVWNNSRYLDCLSDGRDPDAPIKPYFIPDSGPLEVYPFKIHKVGEGSLGFFRRHFQTYMYLRNLAVANPPLMRLAFKLGLIATPPAPPAIARKHPVYFDMFRTDLDTDPHWNQAWSMTGRLVSEIHSVCAQNGSQFLVMIISSPDQIYPAYRERAAKNYPSITGLPLDWPRPGRILNDIFSERRIPSLYLYPLFMEAAQTNPATPYYFTVDIHFNANGHKLVSVFLKEKILELLSSNPG